MKVSVVGERDGFRMTWNAWRFVIEAARDVGWDMPDTIDFCHGGEFDAEDCEELRVALGRSESLVDHDSWVYQFRQFLRQGSCVVTIDHYASED